MSVLGKGLSRRTFLTGGGMVMATVLTGCVVPPVAPAAVTTPVTTTVPTALAATRPFTHTLGISEVPIAPQRIVALHNEVIANTLLQFGVVPVATVNDPPFVTSGDVTFPDTVVSVGGYQEPSLEQIAALKPDLIISAATTHDEIYAPLSAIAPTVPVYDIDASDALHAQRTITDLVGKTELLDEKIAAYDARIAEIGTRLAPLLDTLEVSVFGIYGDSVITTRHPGWTCAKVLADLGISWSAGLLANSDDASFTALSYEEVPDLDADVIFLIEPVAADVEALRATGILDLTFAGQAGQIFTVDDGPWYRGGIIGLNLVLDDIETYLLAGAIDTTGDFR